MKKIILITFFILANSLLESCGPDDGLCYQLEFSGIMNYRHDNFITPGPGEMIPANDYAILLDANGTGNYCYKKSNVGGSLLADIYYVLTDEVKNISIRSNEDLSPNYPAGSELKDLFVPVSIDRSCVENSPEPLDCTYEYYSESLIATPEQALNGAMGENIFLDSRSEIDNVLYVFELRTSEAVTPGQHQITFRIEYESGESAQFTTEEIGLN